jgi:uncharacterized RDD family membrane protein YckC
MQQGGWAQQTAVGPAPGVAFGGFWIRLGAFILDWIILIIIDVICSSIGIAALGTLIGIAYFIGMWGVLGQTVGMMALGLRIVRNSDGGKITWANAILRYIGLIIAFAVIFIGVIWVAFDSRKRGWQHMIGGTVVIKNS